MQRVSGANFLANGNGTGKNAYQDYNPATGQAGTTPNASALNALQEEVANVIEMLGGTLDPSNNSQLYAAILGKISSAIAAATTALFSGTLAANGALIFPNGFILQWCVGTQTDGSGAAAVTFPIEFPTACYRAWATNAASGPPAAFHGTGIPTKTGVTVYSASAANVAAAAGVSFITWAVGN